MGNILIRLWSADCPNPQRVGGQNCSKGTVISRLRFIEQATKTKPEQFRAMSDHLQQMADHYDQSGARAIYQRGLANGDDA